MCNTSRMDGQDTMMYLVLQVALVWDLSYGKLPLSGTYFFEDGQVATMICMLGCRLQPIGSIVTVPSWLSRLSSDGMEQHVTNGFMIWVCIYMTV